MPGSKFKIVTVERPARWGGPCNLSPWEVETGRPRIQGCLSSLCRENLGPTWAIGSAVWKQRGKPFSSHFTTILSLHVWHTWQRCTAPETLIHCWWKMKTRMATWEHSLAVSYTLNICLPYDPAIVFLGCPNELKTYVCTRTCAQMSMAVLLINDKT